MTNSYCFPACCSGTPEAAQPLGVSETSATWQHTAGMPYGMRMHVCYSCTPVRLTHVLSWGPMRSSAVVAYAPSSGSFAMCAVVPTPPALQVCPPLATQLDSDYPIQFLANVKPSSAGDNPHQEPAVANTVVTAGPLWAETCLAVVPGPCLQVCSSRQLCRPVPCQREASNHAPTTHGRDNPAGELLC